MHIGSRLCCAKSAMWALKNIVVSRKSPIFVKNNCTGAVIFVRYVRGLCARSTCLEQNSIDKLRIWKILQVLGVNECNIFRLKRKVRRHWNLWIYSVTAGWVLGVGDILAQYYQASKAIEDRSEFISKGWIKERTFVYVFLGLFLVGPVVSQWNTFLHQKLRCKFRNINLSKTPLDVIILSPFLLALMAVAVDQRYSVNILSDPIDKTKNNFKYKYWPAVTDVMVFNLMTRPLMVLILFNFIPCNLRKAVRKAYEVIFAMFISHYFLKNGIRCPPPTECEPVQPEPIPPEPEKTPPKKSWKWPFNRKEIKSSK